MAALFLCSIFKTTDIHLPLQALYIVGQTVRRRHFREVEIFAAVGLLGAM